VFSPRPGTPASSLEIVDPKISKERLKIFQKISEEIKKDYRKKLLNEKLEVLFENKMEKQEKYFGRDKYGNSVVVESKIDLTGRSLNVKINNFNKSTLFGKVLLNNKTEVAA
jgi:tRNA A37 methylthiotransferase MiaB